MTQSNKNHKAHRWKLQLSRSASKFERFRAQARLIKC
ncbi:adenine phosphoribosyltransferase [Escherichia coli]|nr:adenine phosphoribosyltransferase [Enterobacteriaceae bacterium ENNIH1]RDT56456.1 adenine phosphoribosyltransferase [Escherichia coli]